MTIKWHFGENANLEIEEKVSLRNDLARLIRLLCSASSISIRFQPESEVSTVLVNFASFSAVGESVKTQYSRASVTCSGSTDNLDAKSEVLSSLIRGRVSIASSVASLSLESSARTSRKMSFSRTSPRDNDFSILRASLLIDSIRRVRATTSSCRSSEVALTSSWSACRLIRDIFWNTALLSCSTRNKKPTQVYANKKLLLQATVHELLSTQKLESLPQARTSSMEGTYI